MELVTQLELDWNEATTDGERDLVVEFAVLVIIGYLLGLRREEIVKVDIARLGKYIDVGGQHEEHPHVIIPLVGSLKGETGERCHMLPTAQVTKYKCITTVRVFEVLVFRAKLDRSPPSCRTGPISSITRYLMFFSYVTNRKFILSPTKHPKICIEPTHPCRPYSDGSTLVFGAATINGSKDFSSIISLNDNISVLESS